MLVSIQDFDTIKHGDILKGWLIDHAVDVKHGDIPAVGYVGYIDEMPIACLFLRVSEGLGFAEGMTTNPIADSLSRHIIMDALIVKLLASAYDLGVNKVIGYSENSGILERVERLGFKRLPHVMFSFEIGG